MTLPRDHPDAAHCLSWPDMRAACGHRSPRRFNEVGEPTECTTCRLIELVSHPRSLAATCDVCRCLDHTVRGGHEKEDHLYTLSARLDGDRRYLAEVLFTEFTLWVPPRDVAALTGDQVERASVCVSEGLEDRTWRRSVRCPREALDALTLDWGDFPGLRAAEAIGEFLQSVRWRANLSTKQVRLLQALQSWSNAPDIEATTERYIAQRTQGAVSQALVAGVHPLEVIDQILGGDAPGLDVGDLDAIAQQHLDRYRSERTTATATVPMEWLDDAAMDRFRPGTAVEAFEGHNRFVGWRALCVDGPRDGEVVTSKYRNWEADDTSRCTCDRPPDGDVTEAQCPFHAVVGEDDLVPAVFPYPSRVVYRLERIACPAAGTALVWTTTAISGWSPERMQEIFELATEAGCVELEPPRDRTPDWIADAGYRLVDMDPFPRQDEDEDEDEVTITFD